MADIFVIAEEEIVLAFRLIGVDGRGVTGRDEALDAFRSATAPREKGARPKVLVITEEIGDMLESELEGWSSSGAYPLVVPIPSQRPGPAGHRSIVDAIRRAVGIAV
ncbi:MAG: V-type ATP synthase subunit F [Rectinemataceae bacterium]